MIDSAVVRIYATSQQPDYDSPWQRNPPSNSTGSGVVVAPGQVLTGAHVVANSTFLQVQKVADPDKYVAQVRGICHDADLALLSVEDPRFMDGIDVAEIGELPDLRDPVSVVGYPIGGDEISVTEGVVSRIEVQRYSHSQRELLAVTVDAAINDGNSGGPVFRRGKVSGIAFQSLRDAENIGEMVPAPIIQRFLAGIEDGRQLSIPSLGISVQTLENPALRNSLDLPDGISGVLIQEVDYLGSAQGHLEVGDTLLSIAGHPIANNSTIRYRQQFRAAMTAVLGEMFVGDTIPLGIWRGGQEIEVELVLKPHDWLVPRDRHDAGPTWFVYCGLVFQLLSRNYLRTWSRWWDKAPPEFLYYYYWGIRTEERQQVVALTQILADEATVGYEKLHNEAVTSVNGVAPVDMLDFVKRVESSDGDVVIKLSSGSTIVIDTSTASEASSRICSRYHIGTDRSSDLS